MNINIVPVKGKPVWPLFAPHHYMSEKYVGHRAWLAVLDDESPVGFVSDMPFPSGKVLNARRGHRTVVLPDFQGLGIGAHLSDWLGQYVINEGKRFYSKTLHPRLGAYREASPLWRATTSNLKRLSASTVAAQNAKMKGWQVDPNRVAFSHEYMGPPKETP